MKRFFAILMLFMVLFTGCSNTPNYSVNLTNVKSCNELVKKWVESNQKKNGVYISKSEEKDNTTDFYLYINNLNIVNGKYEKYEEVSVDSVKKDAIAISTKLIQSEQKNDILFVIKVKDSKVKTIILNDINTKVDSILTLK